MLKALPLLLLLLGSVSACGTWTQVPVTVDPASVTDPVKEITAALNMRIYPAAQIQVTEQYIKEVFASQRIVTDVLNISLVGDMRIITQSGSYRVMAYDTKGEELWMYRPAREDLPTCQRFLNAFYALTKRPVPPPPAAAAAPSK